MLPIIFFSNITNNTKRFVEKLEWEQTEQIPIKGLSFLTPDSPYVLVCPSYGTSDTEHIPPQVKKFLATQGASENCVGVIGTGNATFGADFAAAADVISQKLNIPVLYRLELAGTTEDVTVVKQGLHDFESYLKRQTV